MRDYLSNYTGDLQWDNGLVAGESTDDSIRKVLVIKKGELHYVPTLGIGIKDFVNDDDPGALMRDIRKQITADGGDLESLRMEKSNLKIKANYDN
ncbi:MAG: hypothetical protein K9J21_10470 [Bacteroidales bacterium]|nr:hypothetical protein [Bacteroidales bacterium]